MKKYLLIGLTLLIAGKAYALGPYDRQVWKVAVPSTRAIAGTDYVYSEWRLAGDFKIGLSTTTSDIKTVFYSSGSASISGNLDVKDNFIKNLSTSPASMGDAIDLHYATSTLKSADSELLDGKNYDAFVSTEGDVVGGTLSMSSATVKFLNAYDTASSTIGTTGQTIFYGDGSSLSGVGAEIGEGSIGHYHIADSTIQVADIDLSSVTISQLTNDAGFLSTIKTGFSWSVPGDAYVTNGIVYLGEIPFAMTLSSISVSVSVDGTAPAGSSLIYDVKISTGYGANAFYTVLNSTTTDLDIIAGTKRTGTSNLAVTSVSAGDGFRLDIKAVGSGTAGGDPTTCTVWGTKTE